MRTDDPEMQHVSDQSSLPVMLQSYHYHKVKYCSSIAVLVFDKVSGVVVHCVLESTGVGCQVVVDTLDSFPVVTATLS